MINNKNEHCSCEKKKKRYKLIACEVLFREVCLCASRSRNIIDITFMEQGYHDMESHMIYDRLQAEIDKVDVWNYDAILLAYGLCNNGTLGLHAAIPLVIPRAHDCITLMMGSKESYKEYFYKNPGTFFQSSGWLERGKKNYSGGISDRNGLGMDYEYYAELYDEETAKYLFETIGNPVVNYKKIAFINNGAGNIKADLEETHTMAQDNGWDFEEVPGSVSLIDGLFGGDWDSEKYLVVYPGEKIAPTYNDDIVTTIKYIK